VKFAKSLVAIAASAALIAGPVVAGSTVAQAAPVTKAKASGTTLISFKKELAGITKLFGVVKPAKYQGSLMTFPITAVKGKIIKHAGGLTAGDLKLMDPVMEVNAEKKKARITMTYDDGSVNVFYAKHFKVKADGVDGQVWQGNLHLTKNQVTVDTINQALGVDSLEPGMGLGQIRVTIKK
jgi:hypothetical protein